MAATAKISLKWFNNYARDGPGPNFVLFVVRIGAKTLLPDFIFAFASFSTKSCKACATSAAAMLFGPLEKYVATPLRVRRQPNQ